jgi:hypothetical protein
MKFILLFLLMSVSTAIVVAQPASTAFTGAVTIVSYQIDAQGNQVRQQQVPLLVSPNRIRVVGLSRVDASAITTNLGAEDLLIRLDSEDFVFFLRDQTVLSVQKSEIQALLMLASAGQTPPTFDAGSPDMQVRQTNETRQIQGYTARKWIVAMPGSADETHVWISSAFGLNLGMLSESWVSNLPGIRMVPFNSMIEGGRTPLLVETFRGGRKVAVVEMRDLNTQINRSLLEVGTGVRVITLQELMLNRMRSY